jgi:hypothetical protein
VKDLSNKMFDRSWGFWYSFAAMKIQFTLPPVKQRIHFAPATKYFVDKKKKQNKNACR